MPGDVEGRSGDEAREPFDFDQVDWDEDVLELSEQLRRLGRVAGDEQMRVGQMLDVRASLFGYGSRGISKD